MDYLLIAYMPPILVVMRSLALLLIMKLGIYGSNFCHLDEYCLLVVRCVPDHFIGSKLSTHMCLHQFLVSFLCMITRPIALVRST